MLSIQYVYELNSLCFFTNSLSVLAGAKLKILFVSRKIFLKFFFEKIFFTFLTQ